MVVFGNNIALYKTNALLPMTRITFHYNYLLVNRFLFSFLINILHKISIKALDNMNLTPRYQVILLKYIIFRIYWR